MIDPNDAWSELPPDDDEPETDWPADAFGGPELHAVLLSVGTQAEPNVRLIVLDPDAEPTEVQP